MISSSATSRASASASDAALYTILRPDRASPCLPKPVMFPLAPRMVRPMFFRRADPTPMSGQVWLEENFLPISAPPPKEVRKFREGTCGGDPYDGAMTLHACTRCGGTLTDAFRFCPACGLSNDDPGWLQETKPALTFPVVERSRRPRRSRRTSWGGMRRAAGVRLASVASGSQRLSGRILAPVHGFLRRIGAGARQIVFAFGETVRLLIEVAVVSAASVRDAWRSTVALRRLHARRAAVIYSSGCAALSGDHRGVQHARAELRMLDDLITAAAAQPTQAPHLVDR